MAWLASPPCLSAMCSSMNPRRLLRYASSILFLLQWIHRYTLTVNTSLPKVSELPTGLQAWHSKGRMVPVLGRQMFVMEQVASALTTTPAAGRRPGDHHPRPWLPHLQLRLPQGRRSVAHEVEAPNDFLQTNSARASRLSCLTTWALGFRISLWTTPTPYMSRQSRWVV